VVDDAVAPRAIVATEARLMMPEVAAACSHAMVVKHCRRSSIESLQLIR
jgi:hypothetical protein